MTGDTYPIDSYVTWFLCHKYMSFAHVIFICHAITYVIRTYHYLLPCHTHKSFNCHVIHVSSAHILSNCHVIMLVIHTCHIELSSNLACHLPMLCLRIITHIICSCSINSSIILHNIHSWCTQLLCHYTCYSLMLYLIAVTHVSLMPYP